MLNDHLQRQQATDPTGSYIVQAPAGSGKTEILTQRYLRLLSKVTAPEQIVALTFTRKAANEMRERIFLALQQAAEHVEASSSHQQQTLAFAHDALAQDKKYQWQLLKQPNRMRVITIDALCQMLTHAIPLQDKQIPYAHISDIPKRHYKSAARACFDCLIDHTDYHVPITQLLQHVDNRHDQLLALFEELLAHRDQWLPLIYHAQGQDKETYEQALSWILDHELSRLRQSIPCEHAETLVRLTRQLVDIEQDTQSPRRVLRHWTSFDTLDHSLAAALAALLVTSQQTLRKAFDHHVGLKRGACDNQLYDSLKTESKKLLAILELLPDFLPALLRVKQLPKPHYDEEQWEVLQSLFTILPLLAAHLQITFHTHNEVDFSAISEEALHALGSDDAPTDLALYLDNTIHHLLVDEFQDTSLQQFELLSKLVQGFEPHEGKTIFVVGDPMQSIYRFRGAEVGLFLRAKQDGIGPIRLQPLELSSNFRSTALMVDWVNQNFRTIFPHHDDMESGAISFHPSNPVLPTDDHSYVRAYQHSNRADEANGLVEEIKNTLENYPKDSIAILVRSRNQLTHLIQTLREQNIPFQGVDIDLLAKLPHLRDVWSVTQALLMPANRLVWLALLRSPWCGLSLPDLHRVAQYSKEEGILWTLSQANQIPGLTEEGALRACFVYTVLHHALTHRHQQPLVKWLSTTLHHLQLTHILTAQEQDDLEQYWQLLERFEHHGLLDDLSEFKREFNTLYSQKSTPSRLQIMTIHKSKGLEFDTVFLPGLSSKSAPMNTPLLRWLKLPSAEHQDLFLLSPIKAAHHEQCLLYDYLGKLDTEKQSYEHQRLLYVATTRAKKRLILSDHNDKSSQGSFRDFLKHQAFVQEAAQTPLEETPTPYPPMFHLPIHYYQDAPVFVEEPLNTAPLVITRNHIPRLIGLVAHELLQWIGAHHPAQMRDIPWSLATHHLRSLGCDSETMLIAQQRLQDLFTDFFQDPIGQWIMSPHDEEQNELAYLVPHHQGIATKIIDRTFLDEGIRWVIDFKTGQHDPNTELKHRAQVSEYAFLFTNNNQQDSIHCGLYYLEGNHWIVWEYTP